MCVVYFEVFLAELLKIQNTLHFLADSAVYNTFILIIVTILAIKRVPKKEEEKYGLLPSSPQIIKIDLIMKRSRLVYFRVLWLLKRTPL